MTRAALAAAALTLAAPAWAWQPSESRWNPASLPIPYRLNVASIPPSLGAATGQAAVDGGFASWAAPGCTRWRTSNVGTTAVTRASANDRENSILWVSGAWPAELGAVNVTIGVTTPVWRVGGFYIDADIQFNNVGFTWNTTGRGGVDAQSIATHEQGHFLGLDHTAVRGAVMFASYGGGVLRTLSSDDIAGVCALYPSGGPVPDAGAPVDAGVTPPTDPCARAGSCAGCTPINGCGWCAARNLCMSGTASGPTGAACGGPWAWVPMQCAAPTTDAAVTDPCARYTTCGTCTPVDGCGWCGATGRCASGTQSGPTRGTCGGGYAWFPEECSMAGTPSGTAQFGEPCRQPSDCASGGICVGGSGITPFCTRVCVDDCTCPRGYTCGARLTTGQSVCVPGTNTCAAADAGAADVSEPPPPDATVAPMDAAAPPRDAMPPPRDAAPPPSDGMFAPPGDAPASGDAPAPADAPAPGDASGPPLPLGSASSGCGCVVPSSHTPRGPLAALAALGLLALRRRRRASRG
jgi:MYXO-CTERM domain-containing protein